MPSPSSPFFSRPLPTPLWISFDPEAGYFTIADGYQMLAVVLREDLADWIANFAEQSERDYYDRMALIALGLHRSEELTGLQGLDLGIDL